MIITNFFPSHFHREPFRLSFAQGGTEIVSIADHKDFRRRYDGQADSQFIFNYPMSDQIAKHVPERHRRGEHLVVMMDEAFAFFDSNINRHIAPVLHLADRVMTSSDNMLPVYAEFDVAEPTVDVEMEYDWAFFRRLIPLWFCFFWQLQRLLPKLRNYIVTDGFGPVAVRDRVLCTRCIKAYGNETETRIANLADLIVELAGGGSRLVYASYNTVYDVYQDLPRKQPDISAPCEDLGWAPRLGLREGLHRLIYAIRRECA